MTPEEETKFNQLLEELSVLAKLTQEQAWMLYEQSAQNKELMARLASIEAIGKAMQ